MQSLKCCDTFFFIKPLKVQKKQRMHSLLIKMHFLSLNIRFSSVAHTLYQTGGKCQQINRLISRKCKPLRDFFTSRCAHLQCSHADAMSSIFWPVHARPKNGFKIFAPAGQFCEAFLTHSVKLPPYGGAKKMGKHKVCPFGFYAHSLVVYSFLGGALYATTMRRFGSSPIE